MSSHAFDAKEQVRQASDIAAVIGGYLELRRQGRIYVARCPWHDDTRPSLQVNPDRQSWKCWVCDIGGDVYSFVMRREGIEFREALEMLADKAGITLKQQRSETPIEPGSPSDKKTLYAVMAWAEQQFQRFLREAIDAEPARAYLKERSISAESVEKFHIGYAPQEWQWLIDRARGTKFSPEILQAVGLAGKSEKSGRPYDFFRGRVIFPVRDTQHRTIAFGGRILPKFDDGKSGKYLNSPETRLYQKVEQLYGLDVASGALTRGRHVVIMEGYTDVIMANQHGIENVAAVCGTAIGPRHVQPRSLLRRHADRVTLLLDGDEAGMKRTNEVLEMFVAEQIDLRVATLPGGLDPCDFLLEQGADEFQKIIDAAPDALEHSLKTELAGIDVQRDTHAANQALETLLSRIAKAPRLSSDTQTSTRIREGQVLRRLAREFGENEEVLRERLAELRRRGERTVSTPSTIHSETSARPEKLAVEEMELFEIFCLKPQLVAQALEEFPHELLQTTLAQQLFQTYRVIVAEGAYPDAQRVITELEDEGLKNVMTTLDWQAHDRAAKALHSAEERLASVIAHLMAQQDRAALKMVYDGRATHDDALALVQRAIQQQREKIAKQ